MKQPDEPKSKRPRGRPPGIPRETKWGEPTTTKTHRLTPTAHQWVKNNRDKIEQLARQ
jgi:hypothetical protein